MKKFILQVLLFLLPAFVIGITTELLLRKVPNDYAYKKGYLDKNAARIRVLFLGNSHAYYDINPEFIKINSFNASHISQPYNYDLQILRKYENKWHSLKYIVIPADYISLCFRLETSLEKWRIKNYALYYDIGNGAGFKGHTELLNNKLMPNLEMLYQFYIKHKHNINLTSSPLGWGTIYNSKSKKDLIVTGKTASLRHLGNDTLNIEKNLADLKAILAFAQSKNIKVFLFTPPVYKTYLQYFPAGLLNNTFNRVSALAQFYPTTTCISFQNDPAFVANDFYDADHLNESGAEKFSLKIDSLLNKAETIANAK